jgi:hypothetical protein
LKSTLTHLARQKSGPSLGVGRGPNVACEFKRAGFLEGEAIGTSLLIETSPLIETSLLITPTLMMETSLLIAPSICDEQAAGD